MDFSFLIGNVESLALLYGWLFLAAALFALGERICGGLFGARRSPASGTTDPRKS